MTARKYDANGWYEIPRNPISKAGVFPYTKKSIEYPGWQEDPQGIVNVYRPETALSDPETIESFRLIPWVDDHTMLGDPDEGTGLTPPEQKGVHGTTGERIEYDPSDRTLYANLKLWSRSLADAIEAGKKELSMGFRCMYEYVNGVFEGQPYQAIQTHMRGNHSATVSAGRMGPGVAVLDHLTFALDASELREIKMPKPSMRSTIAKKLGLKDGAAFDALLADPTKLKAALDAEDPAEGEGEGDGGSVTLEEAAQTIKDIAGPLGELNEALAMMAGGGENPEAMEDEMEPVLDAQGNQVIENGQPKMQKKGAAQTDAVPAPAVAGMDTAIKAYDVIASRVRKSHPNAPGLVAMDAALATAKGHMARIKQPKQRKGAGMDVAAINKRLKAAEDAIAAGREAVPSVKSVMAEIAQRDVLARRISNVVGAFDHSEMTLAETAKYGMDKLGLKAPAGAEVAVLDAHFNALAAASKPAPRVATAMDAVAGDAMPASVANFLRDGVKAA